MLILGLKEEERMGKGFKGGRRRRNRWAKQGKALSPFFSPSSLLSAEKFFHASETKPQNLVEPPLLKGRKL